jgi:hypothetical protein
MTMMRFAPRFIISTGLLVASFWSASACSSSPADGSGSCPAGQQTCGAFCRNLQSDPQNCGACGTPCASGVCNAGVCTGAGTAGSSGAPGVSGAAGTVGAGGSVGTAGGGPGTGGSGTSGSGTGGGGTGDGLFGGYHTSGDWSGFAFAFASGTATVTPANFEDLVGVDGPFCIKGTVPGTTDYSAIAAVGVHVNQLQAENAEIKTLVPQGDGLALDITVKGGEKTIRVQLEDATLPTDPMAAEHRWCTNLTADASGVIKQVVPWASFNTQCWDAESGTAYAKQPLARAIAYVPDPGTGLSAAFDFCLNDIGPDSVMGRGTGSIVASCDNPVTWSAATLSGTQDASSSGNAYRAQANFWNPVNGNFTMSLLPAAGFKLDTQTCSTTTDSPCSFPSIYVGVDGSGDRSTGSLPKVASTITSIPTCMGWSSGGTPKTDEYNVSFDVWFNSNAQASEAEEFLMIWYRDPPSFQPAGMFPVQNGVVVGGQTWTLWHGPNHQGRKTTSFVAPNGLADGMAYQFDLMDFINEAAERGYITKSKNLIAVMGGLEVWGGGQGASITSFKTAIQ